MHRKTVFATIITLLLGTGISNAAIHCNQIGYYPSSKKIAIATDTTAATFKIKEAATGEEVFSGNLIKGGYFKGSEEYVMQADFSNFDREGRFTISTDNGEASYQFAINKNIYKQPLYHVTRSYYYQRASFELEATYADLWARGSGHPDAGLNILHVDGYDSTTDTRNVPGGWYDAGDYGKYVVNAGITCGTLLHTYEICKELFPDNNLDIPESDNKISDILDEVRYELEWLKTMQDTDGGVFFKVGPKTWPWDFWTPEMDTTKRFVIGKSTTSTLDFSAVMAMAGRIYKEADTAFARDCRDRAENAWNWAIVNPDSGYPTKKTATGPYEDGADLKYKDEFLWASTELWLSTGKQEYKDTVKSRLSSRELNSFAWWQDVGNLAYYSVLLNQVSVMDTAIVNKITREIISYADDMVNEIQRTGYLVTETYSWGSCGSIGNASVVLLFAHFLTGEKKYLNAIISNTDYLFGKNPMSCSYVTGLGTLSPMQPHHRPSTGDDVEEPIPGYVVGGPNESTSGADEELIAIIEGGAPPAMCYIDSRGSWASNEVAINQNAPWVLVLAYLEKNYAASSRVRGNFKKMHLKRIDISAIAEKGGIKITTSQLLSGPVNLQIVDLQGQILESRKYITLPDVVPIKISKGTYLIKLIGNDTESFCRFVHVR